ncbi:MAG: prepilin peptidase, partial [Microcoleus sp. SIO2G3]|nr:prepilin peptidase [Microcoleus sp. SIO2G3]
MDLLYSGLITLIVFVFGTCIGSFLNVVIYRVPAGVSLLHPPSRCPKCLNRLKPYDNVPVVGWLRLRGRCRFCRTRISARYPIVEAVSGLLFVWAFWAFHVPLPAFGYWAFFSWLLALALIDLDTLTLPDSLTRSGLLAGLAFQVASGYAQTHTLAGTIAQLFSGLVGMVLGIWLFDVVTFAGSIAFGQAAMGGGDAKLAAMMGAWLGWKLMLLASFMACGLGALIGGGAIAAGWIDRRQPMPFGPFLALSAVLSAFFGEALISAYLRLF